MNWFGSLRITWQVWHGNLIWNETNKKKKVEFESLIQVYNQQARYFLALLTDISLESIVNICCYYHDNCRMNWVMSHGIRSKQSPIPLWVHLNVWGNNCVLLFFVIVVISLIFSSQVCSTCEKARVSVNVVVWVWAEQRGSLWRVYDGAIFVDWLSKFDCERHANRFFEHQKVRIWYRWTWWMFDIVFLWWICCWYDRLLSFMPKMKLCWAMGNYRIRWNLQVGCLVYCMDWIGLDWIGF